MSQNGKGSKCRVGKPGAYARGYEAIDWSKGRKSAASRKASVTGLGLLVKDYVPNAGVIPSNEELSEGDHKTLTEMVRRQAPTCGGRDNCTNPPVEAHTCPYQEEINGNSESPCTCCADCQYECAMDI